MSIKSVVRNGVELYSPARLEDICLYKCWTNKDILTKEAELDLDFDLGPEGENLDNPWEKNSLRKKLSHLYVNKLQGVGDMTPLTMQSMPILAAIRASQPENLVKVNVSNSIYLKDLHLEFILSGGHVRSLDIHGCSSLGEMSLKTINQFGKNLEFLRIGNSSQILPEVFKWRDESNSVILETPNLKTFVLSNRICQKYELFAKNQNRKRGDESYMKNLARNNLDRYWKFLVHAFIGNLEDLQMSYCGVFETLEFLEPASRGNLTSLTLSTCTVNFQQNRAYTFNVILKLKKLKFLDLSGTLAETHFPEAQNALRDLLTSLSNLTGLNVNPGLAMDILKIYEVPYTKTDEEDEASKKQRRLRFLGTFGQIDDDILAKVKGQQGRLFVKSLAGFGSTERESIALEYYAGCLCRSNHLILSTLLQRLRRKPTPPESESGALLPLITIDLILQSLKNQGNVASVSQDALHSLAFVLLELDFPGKLGAVRVDQVVAVVLGTLNASLLGVPLTGGQDFNCALHLFNFGSDVIKRLEAFLCSTHYEMILPTFLKAGKVLIECKSSLSNNLQLVNSLLANFIKRVSTIFRTVVDRFPEILLDAYDDESQVDVARFICDLITEMWTRKDILAESFQRMIESLEVLCRKSEDFRGLFQEGNGISMTMQMLRAVSGAKMMEQSRPVTLSLLQILKIMLQHPNENPVDLDLLQSMDIVPQMISNLTNWSLKCRLAKVKEKDDPVVQSITKFLLSMQVSDE